MLPVLSDKPQEPVSPKRINDADKKLSLIRGEFNPFEQKHQKAKFEILGRKMKGTSGKPTLSKQVGEENRKKTLLVEMKNKGRRGGIIDKRFGENNPSLTPEEKMLERFTREKQKSAKTSMFNLDDDDEDLSLTHYGQSLSTMDDFDDAGLGLSDEEEGGKQMDRNIVSQMHFGGFDEDAPQNDSDRPKSKNEVMKEIIAKSKMHKAERQLAKQEDDELRENLDEQLADIRGLLETKPARKPLPSQSALFKRTEDEKPKNSDDLDDYADYDKAIFELANDQRAQATDRTKTEEEIAIEEKEKLEKAERARKRRMEGLDSDSEDEGSSKKKSHKKRKGAPQGDDLDDDYLAELEDEVDKLGKGLTLEDIQNGALDDEEEDSEEEEEEDDEEEGDEDDEDDEEEEETNNEDLEDMDDEPLEFGDDDDDDMNEMGQSGIVKKKQTKSPQVSTEKREIPFTFECPTTHEAFLQILEGLEVEDCLVVTKRIRVLYHIKLAHENKAKLSQFLTVLVDHMAYIASTVTPLPTTVLEKLSLHVFELSQQLPESAAQAFHSKLKKMQAEMAKKMKHTTGSAWPDVEDLTMLRLIGQVFSTSDLMHPIATPASLFMCHALSQCRVETEIDIGRGLFLTLLTSEYQAVSKRFIPESINFLNKCLVLLSPQQTFEKTPGYFPLPQSDKPLSITDTTGDNLDTIPRLQLDQLATEETKDIRLSLLQATLSLMTNYLQLYASTPALVEVFESTLALVTPLAMASWHTDIKTLINTLKDRLERQIKFCKEKRIKTPLRMQSHRPIPIAQHLPKFENAYSMDRHYDPDHERSQQRKLEAQLKKEKKGALRELRKDSQFIARERAKERKQKDADYNKYVKGVMNILEGEQSEMKRLERESGKK
ncbi:nucleolar protein 14 [Gilbertella persicaria]|uniref:nucleolar protein 14 n=1 Tax=Gilbertella persicaria TaxID=101096 RepID=UPI0022201086|nr:nucleolar protein 14 [Gilbertella persicaria]KAI8052601.1 nucleolar protein 14 [Gilbertella persicaria]